MPAAPSPSPAVAVRPEAELILCCARTQVDAGTAERIRALLRQELDWPYVLRAASIHGVLPLLARTLRRIEPQQVPEAVLRHLNASLRRNTARNLSLASELVRLLGLLETHGVRAVPYKGPALAASVYGQLALRQIRDLDILVLPADVSRAGALLADHGYVQEEAPEGGQEASLGPRHHHVFHSADGAVIVELHWRVTPRHFEIPLDLARCWERLQPVALAGATVPSFSPEDQLLLLCAHGAKHGWEQLLWIADIAELARAAPALDWGQVMEQSRRAGRGRMLMLGLYLADTLLDAPLPNSVRAQLRADARVEMLAARVSRRLFAPAGAAQGVLEGFWLRWRALERLTDGARFARYFLIRRLTPNRADHELLPLPAALSALYYFVRPLRLAWRFGWGRGKHPRQAGGP